jgi:hypothetical protein
VHTRLLERDPDQHAEHDVGADRPHAEALEHRDRREPDPARHQRGHVDARAVAERDDEDRADVVGDREREQHDAEPGRHAGAEERHAADDEGDVGGHRDAPAVRGLTSRLEREVDRRRHHHAADRRHQRQHRLAGLPQLAEHQLALHLQADDEEEEHHQAVVDPVLERVLEAERPDADAGLRPPEVVEALGERRVGEREGHRRAGEQHQAPRRLDVQETLERADEAIDRLARQRRVVGHRGRLRDRDRRVKVARCGRAGLCRSGAGSPAGGPRPSSAGSPGGW